MATSTISSGYLYAIQGYTTYYNGPAASTPSWAENRFGDSSYFVGQRYVGEYAAVAVEYTVPSISDNLEGRKLTLNAYLYHTVGDSKVSAVLSTQAPTHLGFRFGPTSGVISNVVSVAPEYILGTPDALSLTFTIKDGAPVTDRKIYLYLYANEGEQDGATPVNAVTTADFDDAVLTHTSAYTLSISAGTGGTITVNRTSSSVETGVLSHGDALYYGDKLKITFTPSTNYRLLTTTVNGSEFTSGNTYTVASNVAVASTAQVLASAVGATDADIGSVSTITVTKYNSRYYHSLQYSFGGLSGYITSSGGVQSSETKFSDASVAFTVPTSFYAQIPNAKTGTCTITCRTYSSSSSTTVLGNATTCTFTATATGSPTVSGTIVDTDSTTVALTGNSATLIRYRSNPKCTVTATPKNSSSISTVKIRGTAVTGTTGTNGVVTAEKLYANASYTSYSFAATDSRGYSTSVTLNPTVVSYVELTCSPVISRPTPTGSSIVMSVSGALYRGSFGAASNTLTLDYRYKTTDGSYGSWQTVASSNITLGSSKYTVTNISLGEDFDYKSSYVFQVRARDGATVDGTSYTLSTVTKTIEVQKGIPIFDWGENDFNVNVALMLNNVNILDIMYPVGAVYMHSSSTLPAAVSGVGTWSGVTTGISGVYAWKRTA